MKIETRLIMSFMARLLGLLLVLVNAQAQAVGDGLIPGSDNAHTRYSEAKLIYTSNSIS